MSRAILIPTYPKHFNCNLEFLKSYYQFCTDPHSVDIVFVLTEGDKAEFINVVKGYSVRVITLAEAILKIEGIPVNEPALLEEIKKFNYQSIKKDLRGSLLWL